MSSTAGWIMIAVSGIGILGSILGLVKTAKVFRKQRNRLLEQIETEQGYER